MAHPRIALLLPVRQARRTLASALGDVLAQREVELEVLAIVDAGAGGEDDGSEELLVRAARADSRLTVLRGPGRGVGAALDVGLAAAVAARAPLLAHMEADDRCPPDRLARLVSALASQPMPQPTYERGPHVEHPPGLAAVTSRVGQCGARTLGMRRYLDWQNGLLRHEELARERFIEIPALHQTGLYRTDAVTAIGGYAPHGAWPVDIDFWLRWFEHDAHRGPLPTAKLSRVLYQWRQHPRQSTRSHGGVASAGAHGLDALRAAKAHYLARSLRLEAGAKSTARPVVLLSTGQTLQAWKAALDAVGVVVQAALTWRPGQPPPPAALDAPSQHALVLAAYGSVGVRDRLRASLPRLREPHELLFTA